MRKTILRPAIATAILLSVPVAAQAATTDTTLTTAPAQDDDDSDWGLLGLLGLAGLLGLKRRDDTRARDRH